MTNIAEMPKYQTYKDSTEGWIGDVPEHWDIRKLKHLFYEKKHRPNMSLNCGAISFGKVVTKDDEKILLSTKASYQEVLSGEFLINPLNLNYDLISLRIALSEIDVVVSAGYIVIREKEELQKQYFKYLLHRYDVAYMKLLGSGVRQTISFNHIANSLLVFPPLEEQTRIANFLDKKNALIDEAISIKEKQISLLKERKQIIIQQAVTQGLDPNVPMKDSGVDWIGKIPAHWEIKPLKHILKLQNVKIEAGKSNLEYLGMECVNSFDGTKNEIKSEADGLSTFFQVGNILFGKLRPYLAKVYVADFEGVCSTEFLVYEVKEGSNTFFSKLMLSNGFISVVDASTYGSKMPRASSDFIGNLKIVNPPFEEQIKIASFVDKQNELFDMNIALQKAQIEKLKEYKTTLINSAVTGKIKITPEMVEQ
ncbi:restriction endonuclease subunit S [Providencia rettgeri]|uniref:restriction endonuclease subunit S n=1 Tax=Providencia rettgeri TaxID=587 RepID=UPI0032DB53C2